MALSCLLPPIDSFPLTGHLPPLIVFFFSPSKYPSVGPKYFHHILILYLNIPFPVVFSRLSQYCNMSRPSPLKAFYLALKVSVPPSPFFPFYASQPQVIPIQPFFFPNSLKCSLQPAELSPRLSSPPLFHGSIFSEPRKSGLVIISPVPASFILLHVVPFFLTAFPILELSQVRGPQPPPLCVYSCE